MAAALGVAAGKLAAPVGFVVPSHHDCLLICFLLPSADLIEREEGHRYFELSKPLLSLFLPAAPRPGRPDESHAPSAGSRKESDGPRT